MCLDAHCTHGDRHGRGDAGTQPMGRRGFLAAATFGTAALYGVAGSLRRADAMTAAPVPPGAPRAGSDWVDPTTAIRMLKDGNARFAAGRPEAPHRDLERIRQVAPRQAPFASVLGCADSRVPVEITFDVGFGDVFVNRVAGNIVTPEMIASLEFGCQVLGTSALVVLGHSGCGAVSAAMEGGTVPGMISSLYYHIRPVVAGAKGNLGAAVRANVEYQAQLLLAGSTVLAELVRQEKLRIVGAVYDLPTGRVEWLEPPKAV